MYMNGKLRNAEVVEVGIDPVTKKVIVSVVDDNGEFHNQLFFNLPCGGGMNSWGNYPVQVNHQVLLFMPAYGEPVILGSQYKPTNQNLIANQTDATDADTDVSEYSTADWIASNYDNRLMLSKLNGLILNTNQDARLQLNGDTSVFRISKGGATIDNPLNGQQFIDTLFAYLDALEAKVNANSAAVASQAPYVADLGPRVDADAHTAAALAARTAQPPNEPLAQIEDANADADEAIALDVEAKGVAANVPLAITSAQTKTSAEGNLNLNIKIP